MTTFSNHRDSHPGLAVQDQSTLTFPDLPTRPVRDPDFDNTAPYPIRAFANSTPGPRQAPANTSLNFPPFPTDTVLDWPPDADLIISSLEAGRALANGDRRNSSRVPYRTLAVLRLFSDLEGTDPWKLYTRDIDARGLGFITRHRLPLGYGGTVRLLLPAPTPLIPNAPAYSPTLTRSTPNNRTANPQSATNGPQSPLVDDLLPRELHAHCTLLRCREAAPGWFEGALTFNRPQDL